MSHLALNILVLTDQSGDLRLHGNVFAFAHSLPNRHLDANCPELDEDLSSAPITRSRLEALL